MGRSVNTSFGEAFSNDFKRLAKIVKGQSLSEESAGSIEDTEGFSVIVTGPNGEREVYFVPDSDTAEDLRSRLQRDIVVEPMRAGQLLEMGLDYFDINFSTLDADNNLVWVWPYDKQDALSQMLKRLEE